MKAKYVALCIVIILLLLALFTLFQSPGLRNTQSDIYISYSQFLVEIDAGKVRDVLFRGYSKIHGTFKDDRGTFQIYVPNDPTLIPRLYGKGVTITTQPLQDDIPWFVSLVMSWLPFIALIWFIIHRTRRPKS